MDIFLKPSSNNLSIVLKITGFPFKGIRPDGILPKIFSNSFSIFPALKISTLTFSVFKFLFPLKFFYVIRGS